MQGKQLTMLLAVLYGGAFLAGFNENLVNMGLIASWTSSRLTQLRHSGL